LIIDRLADVSQAIAFAKEQDDADLWEDLLNYSMTNLVSSAVYLRKSARLSTQSGSYDGFQRVLKLKD
jgi:uncharacterized protein with PIN domain